MPLVDADTYITQKRVETLQAQVAMLQTDVQHLWQHVLAADPPPQSYAVLIEHGPTSYGASIPDLPGCVAVGHTLEEVTRLIQDAMIFHLEGMRADGEPIPAPTTRLMYIAAQR